MELVVSAIAGDLVNRFISFLINKIKKYEGQPNLEEKMERLQHLLLRVHMVVEEAEGRHITNSKMLLQFKKLLGAMYHGYHVLDTIKYRNLCSSRVEEEVGSSNTLSVTISANRFHAAQSAYSSHELESTLDNLETIASNMAEFVFLLGGCERMSRSPYDSYLYIDNFMFGRHIEKQQVINILLQDNLPPFAPTVLPIIGTRRVGKKTLVAHVCNNEKVRSHFCSILHLNGENIGKTEHETFIPGRTLVVVEFTSDLDDENWQKFYSSAAHMARGSKIIIISRIENLARFGTVRPIRLNRLLLEEYSYLFKVLAFGSTNPEEHPQLVSIANELAVMLGGSLVTANMYADIFRKNQNVNFWLCVLNKFRNVVENNFSVFGEHPKLLVDKDRQVDITKLASSSTPLRLMPPHSLVDDSNRELSEVKFGDLIAGSAVLPKEEFQLVAWESRIPPYKRFVSLVRFVNLATYCEEENISQHEHTALPSKKRKRLDKQHDSKLNGVCASMSSLLAM